MVNHLETIQTDGDGARTGRLSMSGPTEHDNILQHLARLDARLRRLRQVASFSFIGAARSGGGSGVMGDGGNSTCSVLLGHRRALLLLRGLLGFGAGSCLYWTVRALPRLQFCKLALHDGEAIEGAND